MDEEIAGMVVKLAMESGSFQEQLRDINNDLKIVESEFKASGYSANSFGESLDGLQANLKRCNDVLELQKQAVDVYQKKVDESQSRVESLSKRHEELASKIQLTKRNIEQAVGAYGENSKEAEELNKELSKLESMYGNNEKSLLRANSTLKTNIATYNNAIGKVKQYEQSLNDTKNDIENFGKAEVSANEATRSLATGIGMLDVALGSLLSGGIQQVIEWFTQGIDQSIEFAFTVEKVSQQIQMSSDDVQKWSYAFQTVGLDLEGVSGDLANFNEKIQDTVNGVGDGDEVFTALGISVQEANGTLRSTSAVLQETVMKLQNMEDQTLRNAYASKLLSTTGEEMIPILNMTNKELAQLQGNASIVKEDDIVALNELKASLLDFMDTAGKPLIGILGDISKILVPLINLAGDFLEPILWGIEAFTSFIGDGFQEAFGFIDETNDKIKDSNNKTMEGLTGGVNGLKDATNEATDYINKALDKFYSEELSNYEKELRDQIAGDITLADEKWIQKKLAKEEARIEKEKQKELEKTQQMLEQKERMYNEHYKKLFRYKQSSSGGSYSNIQSYNTGTKYHPGGLAMVHKDEFVDLPRGTKVYTKSQTSEMVRNNTTNNSPTYNFGPINVTAKADIKDVLRDLEDLARRK